MTLDCITATDKERLRNIRADEDWSYRELAGLIGMKPRTLHRDLTSDTAPNERTARKIRKFLDLYEAQRERERLRTKAR